MAVPGLSGGEAKPIIKLNAKAGKVVIDDKAYERMSMIVDMPNAEVGYISSFGITYRLTSA